MESEESFIPTLTYAVERDIDLMLIEELKCDNEFIGWLLSYVTDAPVEFKSSQVLHSKRRTFNRREIDIHIELREGSRTEAILLLENKLDEKEQPGQGLTYQDEKKVLVDGGRTRRAYAILICPKAYRQSWPDFANRFDAVVTYEDVERYLQSRMAALRGELRLRLEHKKELLGQAIGKQRRGYDPIPIQAIADFNAQYRKLLNEIAPEIVPGPGLRKPNPKPSDSVSMIFDPAASFGTWPKEILPTRFSHELGRGSTSRANFVNVQFRNFDVGFQRLSESEKKTISRAGLVAEIKTDRRSNKKILKLKLPTPAVDNQLPFEDSKQKLRDGISAAARLRKWCLANETLIRRIGQLSIF